MGAFPAHPQLAIEAFDPSKIDLRNGRNQLENFQKNK